MAASPNRKTSTKPIRKVYAGAAIINGEWAPHDYQVRQTALDNAVRVLGGTTTSPGVALKAANQSYAFLTGK